MAVEILRVGLDPTPVETGVRRARRAYADLARGAHGVAAGSETASTSLRRVAGQSDQTQKAVQRLGRETGTTATSVRRLQGALGGLGIALGVREIAVYADTWRLIEGRLRLVTGSTEQLRGVQESLFRIAQETRTEYEAVAVLYARVARNAEQLGRSQAELLDFTEAVQKSIQVSGATAQEASAGVIQLSQALSSGQLRGEEFRSVSEQMPDILLRMEQALGKTAGELRAMAFEGELTSDIVVQAMLDMKESIDRDFANVPVTIGQSFTVLNNEIQRFIGEGDNAHGVSQALSTAIITLSKNLGTLVTATGALAALYAGRWLADYAASTRGVIAAKQAERAATVQASFAAQVESAAYMEATAAKVRDTEATLANLTATRAAIAVSRQEAVAQLARARAVQAAAAAVPIASLAPLGGAAVARELAKREAATRAVSAATAELGVLGQQQARIETQLTAATAAHTRAQTANATATGVAATASRAHAASLTLTTRAMAVATTAARGLWLAIGGPIGATLIGLFAVYEIVQRLGKGARDAADEARQGVQDFTASLQEMEAAALRSERAALEFQVDALQRMRDATPQTLTVATGSFLNGGIATIRNPALAQMDGQAAALELKLIAVNEAIEAIFAPRQRSTDLTQDIRDSAEDLIRSAQQSLELAGMDREAQSRRAIEHRAINKLVEAERDLSGEALEHMKAAIETERQLSQQALTVAAAFEKQQKAAERIAEAMADIARYVPQVIEAFTVADRLVELGQRRQAERAERVQRGEDMGMVLTRVTVPGAATQGAADTNSATRAISEGVRGLVDLGDAAGVLGDNARRAISGVSGLVSSIDSFGSASSKLGQVGAALGIAGAAAGIISSLFSGDNENARVTRENTRALERLRQSFEDTTRDDFSRGVGIIDAIQAIRDPIDAIQRLAENMDILGPLAEQFGINLEKNAFVGLQQLEDALRMASDRAFEFANTLAGTQARQDALNEIFDRTSPEDQLASQYGVLSQFAGDVLRQFGGANLNTDTAAGRSALEQALRDAITAYANGTLDPALLGNFASGQEFVDLLLGTDRALDAFKESLQDAASAVTDIPRAVNLALFRSRVTQSAMDDVTGTPPAGGVPGTGGGGSARPGARPPEVEDGGGRRPRPRIEGQAVYNLTFAPGSVVTQARNGEELLRDLERAAADAKNKGRRVSLPGVRTEGM